MLKIIALTAATCLCIDIASAASDNSYAYRISNGYNGEVRGKISYRVEKAEAGRVEVAVSTDTPGAGDARTEIYAPNGNWLRRALASHDQLREYEFATPLPVYVPPDAADGAWTVRVDAVEPGSGRRSSVRVDNEVLGRERVTVPAGTFDTIKIKRWTYLGDWDSFLRETRIEETDWYAPALGRPVKTDSKSSWQDISRCVRSGCPWFRGDWNVFELVEVTAAKP